MNTVLNSSLQPISEKRPSPASGRVSSLDVLRGIAVLLVLGRHLERWPDSIPEPVSTLLSAWKQIGWCGVDLFFVLSGFLVSGLLIREYQTHGNVNAARFMIRRGFKIYPSFYIMLIASLIAMKLFREPIKLSAVMSEVFFVQSYVPRLWNHTWTLAVEEHFYILLAGMIWWLTRKSTGVTDPFTKLLPIFLCLAFAVGSCRVWNALSREYSHQTHLIPTHLRIDALFFGSVLSYAWHYHRATVESFIGSQRFAGLLLVAMFASPIAFFRLGEGTFLHSFGFGLASLAAGLLVLATLNWQPLRNWPMASRCLSPFVYGLTLIGVHSYSIYLWHMPIQHYFPRLLGRLFYRIGSPIELSYGIKASIYLIGSVIIGVLFSKLIDLPCLSWRDRLFPSRARPLT